MRAIDIMNKFSGKLKYLYQKLVDINKIKMSNINIIKIDLESIIKS